MSFDLSSAIEYYDVMSNFAQKNTYIKIYDDGYTPSESLLSELSSFFTFFTSWPFLAGLASESLLSLLELLLSDFLVAMGFLATFFSSSEDEESEELELELEDDMVDVVMDLSYEVMNSLVEVDGWDLCCSSFWIIGWCSWLVWLLTFTPFTLKVKLIYLHINTCHT